MPLLCRLCLADRNLVNLFDKRLKNGKQLRMCVYLCTGVEIKITDTIEKVICHKCCSLAVKLFQYRQIALANDKALKELINQPTEAIPADKSSIKHLHERILKDISDPRITEASIRVSKKPIEEIRPPETDSESRTSEVDRSLVHDSVDEIIQYFPDVLVPKEILDKDLLHRVSLDEEANSRHRFRIGETTDDEVTSNFKRKHRDVQLVNVLVNQPEQNYTKRKRRRIIFDDDEDEEEKEHNEEVSERLGGEKEHRDGEKLLGKKDNEPDEENKALEEETKEFDDEELDGDGRKPDEEDVNQCDDQNEDVDDENCDENADFNESDDVESRTDEYESRSDTESSRTAEDEFEDAEEDEEVDAEDEAEEEEDGEESEPSDQDYESDKNETNKTNGGDSKISSQPYTNYCEQCDRYFWGRSQLMAHQRVHFKCDICKKGFPTVDDLDDHQSNICFKLLECREVRVRLERADENLEYLEKYKDVFEEYFEDMMMSGLSNYTPTNEELNGLDKEFESKSLEAIFEKYKHYDNTPKMKSKKIQTRRRINEFDPIDKIVLDDVRTELQLFNIPVVTVVDIEQSAHISFARKPPETDTMDDWSSYPVKIITEEQMLLIKAAQEAEVKKEPLEEQFTAPAMPNRSTRAPPIRAGVKKVVLAAGTATVPMGNPRFPPRMGINDQLIPQVTYPRLPMIPRIVGDPNRTATRFFSQRDHPNYLINKQNRQIRNFRTQLNNKNVPGAPPHFKITNVNNSAANANNPNAREIAVAGNITAANATASQKSDKKSNSEVNYPPRPSTAIQNMINSISGEVSVEFTKKNNAENQKEKATPAATDRMLSSPQQRRILPKPTAAAAPSTLQLSNPPSSQQENYQQMNLFKKPTTNTVNHATPNKTMNLREIPPQTLNVANKPANQQNQQQLALPNYDNLNCYQQNQLGTRIKEEAVDSTAYTTQSNEQPTYQTDYPQVKSEFGHFMDPQSTNYSQPYYQQHQYPQYVEPNVNHRMNLNSHRYQIGYTPSNVNYPPQDANGLYPTLSRPSTIQSATPTNPVNYNMNLINYDNNMYGNRSYNNNRYNEGFNNPYQSTTYQSQYPHNYNPSATHSLEYNQRFNGSQEGADNAFLRVKQPWELYRR